MSAMMTGVLLSLLLVAGSSAATGVPDSLRLVVEEYRLFPCSGDVRIPPALPLRLPDSIGRKRERWRYDLPLSYDVDKINKVIEPLGYSLRRVERPTRCTPSYDFLKADSVIVPLLYDIGRFSIDSSTNRFLFTATEDHQAGPPYGRDWLILDGKPQPWDPGDHDYSAPLLLNGHLVTYDLEPAGKGRLKIVVRQDSAVIYTGMTKWKLCTTTSSICGLSSYGHNWVLSCPDTVIVNGSSLRSQLHCDAVNLYAVIHGAPFCLLTRDGKVRMFFGASGQPYTYDYIQQGGECGESYSSPGGNDNMVWFYARRDGWWYYVEAGVYNRTK